jgi:dTMP kinase
MNQCFSPPTPTLETPGLHPFVVVVEGVDFSGKSTLARSIQTELQKDFHLVKLLHDPKGTKHGQCIWETIVQMQQAGGHPITEFFLFLAARNELIHQEALSGDADVLLFDRFLFSTLAYQLTDQPASWEPFLTTHRFFSKLMPNLCVYCDIDFETFQQRSQHRDKQDSLDQLSQGRFEAIRAAYKAVVQLNLCPTVRVDGNRYDLPTVMNAIRNYIPRSRNG